MKYKYCLKDAFKFGWDGLEGFSYNEKDDFDRASAAIFKVTKRHGLVKTLVSDRIYLVLEGEGKFIIDNNTIDVKATDVIIVPRNTEYDYSGTMKLFLVHSPAYDANNDIDIENMQK